jgi:hypothetical protein
VWQTPQGDDVEGDKQANPVSARAEQEHESTQKENAPEPPSFRQLQTRYTQKATDTSIFSKTLLALLRRQLLSVQY